MVTKVTCQFWAQLCLWHCPTLTGKLVFHQATNPGVMDAPPLVCLVALVMGVASSDCSQHGGRAHYEHGHRCDLHHSRHSHKAHLMKTDDGCALQQMYPSSFLNLRIKAFRLRSSQSTAPGNVAGLSFSVLPPTNYPSAYRYYHSRIGKHQITPWQSFVEKNRPQKNWPLPCMPVWKIFPKKKN